MTDRSFKDLTDSELLELLEDLERARDRAEAELMARRSREFITGEQIMCNLTVWPT